MPLTREAMIDALVADARKGENVRGVALRLGFAGLTLKAMPDADLARLHKEFHAEQHWTPPPASEQPALALTTPLPAREPGDDAEEAYAPAPFHQFATPEEEAAFDSQIPF